jgi:hypothetical protein
MPNLPVAPFFVAFFTVMAVAIAASRHAAARRAGVALLLALLFYHGLTGRMTWPFFSWHLYGRRASTTLDFHQLRLADAAGREVRYEPLAVPPALPSPLRRLAGRLPGLEEPGRGEVARFLLERARARRRAEAEGTLPRRWLHFPAHQAGAGWDREALVTMGAFETLRVYAIHVELDPTGRDVLSRREAVVWEHP